MKEWRGGFKSICTPTWVRLVQNEADTSSGKITRTGPRQTSSNPIRSGTVRFWSTDAPWPHLVIAQKSVFRPGLNTQTSSFNRYIGLMMTQGPWRQHHHHRCWSSKSGSEPRPWRQPVFWSRWASACLQKQFRCADKHQQLRLLTFSGVALCVLSLRHFLVNFLMRASRS